MSETFEIKGLANFRRGLQDLPLKLARRILTKALKEAADVLAEATRSRVPVDTGALKEDIVIKTKSYSPWEVGQKVQAVTGGKNSHTAWYASLVEYGSSYVIKKGKKVVAAGRIPPQPFMRPAFEAEQANIQTLMVERISAEATKLWKKLNG